MLSISNLILEVTRKCNMTCEHCLRGNAMNVNMKKEYIDSLLSQVNYINMVTFSGGEPSLNVPIMEYFLEQCKLKRVSVGSFYIATNGLDIKDDFVLFCCKMYAYCEEKEMCQVDLSNDSFHDYSAKFDYNKMLDALSFFKFKFEDGQKYILINEGRAKDLNERKRENEVYGIDQYNDIEEFLTDSDVYMNCNGEIINGCNWSYKSQREHKLCNVADLEKVLK